MNVLSYSLTKNGDAPYPTMILDKRGSINERSENDIISAPNAHIKARNGSANVPAAARGTPWRRLSRLLLSLRPLRRVVGGGLLAADERGAERLRAYRSRFYAHGYRNGRA